MKNFKEFAIPTVALFLICLVATTLLAVTNKVTAPKIAELSAQTEVETRQKVLPAATQFGDTQEMKGGSGTYAVGKDASGNEGGYVFVTVSKGYGGDVKIMTGIDKNGAVTGISPLELNETAGLGMKAQNTSFLDQFKGTLYRQTMFAEFELEMGKLIESGEALTADALSEKYHALNKLYFGPDMVSDDEIALEWTRIPHIYYNYYVFQYATSLSAAVAIANRILREGESAVKDYKKFLSGGCSKEPVELLRDMGVDMRTPAPVNDALSLFGELIDELSELLG